MTVEQLIGFAIGIGGLIGGIVWRDRHVMNTIKDGDSKCHDRINRQIRDINNCVTKDDIRQDFKELKEDLRRNFSEIKVEQKETNRRIDNALAPNKKE